MWRVPGVCKIIGAEGEEKGEGRGNRNQQIRVPNAAAANESRPERGLMQHDASPTWITLKLCTRVEAQLITIHSNLMLWRKKNILLDYFWQSQVLSSS